MDKQMAEFIKALSILLGWLYVYSWSASFYPQPMLNWQRKSTGGLTVDFPALNVLGFVAYSISNAAFLFSPTIKKQYAARHPSSPESTVRINDFVFAAHAMILVLLTYSQFYARLWRFKVSKDQRTSLPIRIIVSGSIVAVLLGTLRAANSKGTVSADVQSWTWIDVVYIFGHIKLLATFVKYIPQAWLNYKRKSTKGWSIGQILFDAAGGIFSLAQLLIDASFQNDWSGVYGNLPKFGLSNISLFFDFIFILQHYVLYRGSTDSEPHDTQEPLLSAE